MYFVRYGWDIVFQNLAAYKKVLIHVSRKSLNAMLSIVNLLTIKSTHHFYHDLVQLSSWPTPSRHNRQSILK